MLVRNVGEGALQFTLIAFIGFFFYRDGPALVQALRNALNRVAGQLAGGLLQTVGSTVNGVVYGILAFGFVGIFLGPTLLAVGYNLARSWTA